MHLGKGKRSRKRPRRSKSGNTAAQSITDNISNSGDSLGTNSSTSGRHGPKVESAKKNDETSLSPGGNFADVLGPLEASQSHSHGTDSTAMSSPPETESSRTTSRVYPVTLVNGTYYEHNPNSLPEPLAHGFMAWAIAQREAKISPLSPGDLRWNNRTLRFWRLSTDFSRFNIDGDEDEEAGGLASLREGSNISEHRDGEVENRNSSMNNRAQLTPFAPSPRNCPAPQRPYTAPPHQDE